MLDYQIMVILIFGCFLLSTTVIGVVGSIIKKHKSKKQIIADLERENRLLKDKIYSLKFQAKLRGVNLDV